MQEESGADTINLELEQWKCRIHADRQDCIDREWECKFERFERE